MPPRRRKSPERPTSSKSLEGSRFYVSNVKERATAVTLPSVVPSMTRRVSFAPTLPSVRVSQGIGDSRISLKTLLNAIKTMEGRLEGKIDTLASRPLLSEESSNFLKQDNDTHICAFKWPLWQQNRLQMARPDTGRPH